MADFTSEEVQKATGARLLSSVGSVLFHDVCTDTRAVEKGSLFVAFKGTSFDGHDFVLKALSSGAAGAVVSELRPEYKGAARTDFRRSRYAQSLSGFGSLSPPPFFPFPSSP